MIYLSLCNRYSDTPAALSNYLGMTRGTASQTLALLRRKKALLKKNANTSNRRVVYLGLLPEGQVIERTKPAELFNLAVEHLKKAALDLIGLRQLFVNRDYFILNCQVSPLFQAF